MTNSVDPNEMARYCLILTCTVCICFGLKGLIHRPHSDKNMHLQDLI